VATVDEFFRELDARWGEARPAKIHLRIIGSSALMLQTNYERRTKDSDVLETNDLTANVKKRMLDLGGLGTGSRSRILIVRAEGLPSCPVISDASAGWTPRGPVLRPSPPSPPSARRDLPARTSFSQWAW
jgi:hypothetical protein